MSGYTQNSLFVLGCACLWLWARLAGLVLLAAVLLALVCEVVVVFVSPCEGADQKTDFFPLGSGSPCFVCVSLKKKRRQGFFWEMT